MMEREGERKRESKQERERENQGSLVFHCKSIPIVLRGMFGGSNCRLFGLQLLVWLISNMTLSRQTQTHKKNKCTWQHKLHRISTESPSWAGTQQRACVWKNPRATWWAEFLCIQPLMEPARNAVALKKCFPVLDKHIMLNVGQLFYSIGSFYKTVSALLSCFHWTALLCWLAHQTSSAFGLIKDSSTRMIKEMSLISPPGSISH